MFLSFTYHWQSPEKQVYNKCIISCLDRYCDTMVILFSHLAFQYTGTNSLKWIPNQYECTTMLRGCCSQVIPKHWALKMQAPMMIIQLQIGQYIENCIYWIEHWVISLICNNFLNCINIFQSYTVYCYLIFLKVVQIKIDILDRCQ